MTIVLLGCSEGSFQGASNKTKGTPAPEQTPVIKEEHEPDGGDVEEQQPEQSNGSTEPEGDDPVEVTCANGERQQKSLNITFPASTATCPWGVEGNLAAVDAKFQARIEQEQSISLPRDAILCSVQFSFPTQTIKYDDHILLTLGDVVLMGSIDFPTRAKFDKNEDGHPIYSWTKLRGLGFTMNEQNKPDYSYCIDGKGTCQVPKTETSGSIRLKIKDETIQSLVESARKKNIAHKFKLITVGDDNSEKDCKHAAITFDVAAEYVMP